MCGSISTLEPERRGGSAERFQLAHHLSACERQPRVSRLNLADGSVKRYLSDARHKLEPLLGPLPDADDEVTVEVTPRSRR